MRGTRVWFAVSTGVAAIAACSGANQNALLTSGAFDSGGGGGPGGQPIACGSTSCTSAQPFCCEPTPSLDGAKADGGVEACWAAQASCAGSTAIKQCSSGQNCGGGQVCCRLVASGVTSQLCELSCAFGESQLCASTSECSAGDWCQMTTDAADAGTTGACISSADSSSPDADSGAPDARLGGDHDAGGG
ncbi:MAG TPA: hypothetical protein VN894_06260 [Polyangiaceae bacterium]|nr:hypothetical protein [Polyangiaceae bacterium]